MPQASDSSVIARAWLAPPPSASPIMDFRHTNVQFLQFVFGCLSVLPPVRTECSGCPLFSRLNNHVLSRLDQDA